MKAKSGTKYRVIDLFAGAGGLSCGFLQTGRFDVIAAFENNPHAQKTYRKNHPGTVVYSDVDEALNTELGRVDVVIGGPPCQGFSNANRQKNHAISHNNSLVKKYVDVILKLKPMAFIMENVSTLPSNTHRFYVDRNDAATIKEYAIKTEESLIPLLDEHFMFDSADDIVTKYDLISRFRWANENDYLTLNVLYKYRGNPLKFTATLAKHRSRLLSLAKRFIENQNTGMHIGEKECAAGKIILQFFAEPGSVSEDVLCNAVEPIIIFQRMLSKAKELLDNNISVSEYAVSRGLAAKVKSMAVIDYIEAILGASSNEYTIAKGVLSAASFGVPQKRMRFVIVGMKKSVSEVISLPEGSFSETDFRTVRDAISDIESLATITDAAKGENGIVFGNPPQRISQLGEILRDSGVLYNHVSTETTPEALKRFKVIKQGDNFHSLTAELKTNYSNPIRTQNTIYLRLNYNELSGTVVNVRKSMWIHPVLNRALSIREAARLQTFPDSFIFFGTKDAQYQQVGNAVPPMLAKAIANHLCEYLDRKKAIITYLADAGKELD
ncbi:MAG: DNA cytosine methyltransferase [Desulfarculales bacterium]|jgi:DNA (cytosine-5)-methyltransferase 1|nr:DNA cytosine methyltransferase [Desulfarculales bacterium]